MLTMIWIRRIAILATLVLMFSFAAWAVPRAMDPSKKGPEKRAKDRRWVNTSPYFWDRQACRWVSLCGLHHLRKDPAARGDEFDDDMRGELKRRATNWEEDAPKVNRKRDTKGRRRILQDVPEYVTRYAPLVHLYSGEEFWPSDIKEHVEHMTVYVDDKPMNTTEDEEKWTLDNLHKLNNVKGKVILRSDDDVESRPTWLHSHDNIPNPFESDPSADPDDSPDNGNNGGRIEDEPTNWYDVDKDHPLHRITDPRQHRQRRSDRDHAKRLTARGHKPDDDGFSAAPAVLVVVDKGNGVIDAFWFFFYSYNLGQTVLGVRFGNHVGDWEHCMVRFENGHPRGVFFSEHEGGQAYAWDAVEKSKDGRPIIYSAVGSHAMYSLPGDHPYIIPFGLLKDVTDKGPLWDPALNNYAYHYDYEAGFRHKMPKDEFDQGEPHGLVPAAKNPSAPTSWFHFAGRWGDDVYSLADPRQWRFFGQYHYVMGPDGPKFKELYRSKMCQTEKCRISYKLDPHGKWY